MSSPLHLVYIPSPEPAPNIFTFGKASDPQSPSHESSAEIETPKVNPTPRNNPTNPVPNVPANTDSDPGLSDSYLYNSSDSSDYDYYNIILFAKKNKNKGQSKTGFDEPIKKCENLTAKLLKSAYKSSFIKFKLDKYPLHHRVYFLSVINSLEIVITI